MSHILLDSHSVLPVKRASGKKSDRRRVWHFMERVRRPRKRRDAKPRSVVDFGNYKTSSTPSKADESVVPSH